jgi:hypothetical protein
MQKPLVWGNTVTTILLFLLTFWGGVQKFTHSNVLKESPYVFSQ